MADTPKKSEPILTNELFHQLRREWTERVGLTFADLARNLHTTPQRVANWAHGTSDRAPPWWVVLAMCRRLKMGVFVKPDGTVYAVDLKNAPKPAKFKK